MKETVKAESYTLRTSNGAWLGQVVITSDGMFSGVTDWGNFGYAWRSFGPDFKQFLLEINTPYFGDKLATGAAYVMQGKKVDMAAQRFAKKILPALQEVLKQERESNPPL